MIKILFILILLNLSAHHEYWKGKDCELKYRYEKALSSYDETMHNIVKMYEDNRNMNGNKAALIKESTDTLNKNEIVYTKFVEGTVVQKEVNWIGISGGHKVEDTLTIFIGDAFVNEAIEHIIIDGKVKTFFTESYSDDEVLKLRKEDSLTNSLRIEVWESKFELCKEGNVYYGYSKMKVDPYFRMDIHNSNQFLQIQRNYEYYFKFEIE